MTPDFASLHPGYLLPDTLSFALTRIVDKSDETVVAMRMALIAFALCMIKSETDFFRDIRIVR
ncbi:MAG: hypothetical protein HYX37_01875 [Rhizobiales bacterium]|nr:hypothetical protein [Hyphomicrobiales bacterium]